MSIIKFPAATRGMDAPPTHENGASHRAQMIALAEQVMAERRRKPLGLESTREEWLADALLAAEARLKAQEGG
ncbi:hypothetical protein [Reyranella sp.]|uniref:hypothetical protein n=1 Tax=Reyranella sp. TaxID=1929291 RepID=UPI001215FE48|nr:hypothetical protein [Reyranella sp.]TAJ89719.1 MAG: hypothetical protein EPO50_04970 [Reyranella sp.]